MKYRISIILFTCLICLFAFGSLAFGQNFESPGDLPSAAEHPSPDVQLWRSMEYGDSVTIRHIIIEVRDVFSPALGVEEQEEIPWYGRVGNMLHANTRNWVVTDHLLFHEGEKLNLYKLSESERLLRESDLFVDAQIYPRLIQNSRDSVDIVVRAQDRWTLTTSSSYELENKSGYLGLDDDNFFGTGHRLSSKFTFDDNKRIGVGWEMKYTVANIMGSYIRGRALISENNKTSKRTLSFNRDFFSTTTLRAGGVDLNWIDNRREIYDGDTLVNDIPFSQNKQYIWYGRAFPLDHNQTELQKRVNLSIAAAIDREEYPRRPTIEVESNRIFENSTLYLGSIGIAKRGYYKDYYINRFGITEDIPVGSLIALVGGLEQRETVNRMYAGLDLAFAKRWHPFGYLSAKFTLGGFRKEGIWEQSTLRSDVLYHSALAVFNKWKMRLYMQGNVLMGFNRFLNEQIYLDLENGLRGFKEYSLQGTRRAFTSVELRLFSPYSVLGFRLGANVFADAGMIGYGSNSFENSPVYQSFGIGLRTQNERLSRKALEIALIYSPNNPNAGNGSFDVLIRSTIAIPFENFSLPRPTTLRLID